MGLVVMRYSIPCTSTQGAPLKSTVHGRVKRRMDCGYRMGDSWPALKGRRLVVPVLAGTRSSTLLFPRPPFLDLGATSLGKHAHRRYYNLLQVQALQFPVNGLGPFSGAPFNIRRHSVQ